MVAKCWQLVVVKEEKYCPLKATLRGLFQHMKKDNDAFIAAFASLY
jgi:hypothetical protein